MIAQALIILLVILVIANFAVGVFNKISPPCMSGSEYFQGVNRLPDGSVAGLGSIPTHEGYDYVGAARVATGKRGVIGLTSYSNQKNGYIGDTTDTTQEYINPVVNALNDEDPSDCGDRNVSEAASCAIDAVLQPGKKHKLQAENKTGIIDKTSESLGEYEANIDTILSKNADKSQLKGRHMSIMHNIARDGYTSRPGDACA